MTTLDATVLRRALLVERGIERRLDELVRLANTAALRLEQSPNMETAQLRNLLTVAQRTPAVEAVINFVRYQIGRNHRERAREPNPWGSGPDGFGHTVIGHLRNEFAAMAGAIVAEVEAVAGAEASAAETRRQIHVQLMQLYIGYIGRGFSYASKVKSFNDLRGGV